MCRPGPTLTSGGSLQKYVAGKLPTRSSLVESSKLAFDVRTGESPRVSHPAGSNLYGVTYYMPKGRLDAMAARSESLRDMNGGGPEDVGDSQGLSENREWRLGKINVRPWVAG